MRKIRKEPFNLTTPWTEKMGALVLDQTPHHRDQGEREPASSDPSITHRTSALESLIKIRPQLLHLWASLKPSSFSILSKLICYLPIKENSIDQFFTKHFHRRLKFHYVIYIHAYISTNRAQTDNLGSRYLPCASLKKKVSLFGSRIYPGKQKGSHALSKISQYYTRLHETCFNTLFIF